MDRAEVLKALENKTVELMLKDNRDPQLDLWLLNNFAVLVSVCQDQERVLNHLCPDKSDDI